MPGPLSPASLSFTSGVELIDLSHRIHYLAGLIRDLHLAKLVSEVANLPGVAFLIALAWFAWTHLRRPLEQIAPRAKNDPWTATEEISVTLKRKISIEAQRSR